jgi:hypothetical protein
MGVFLACLSCSSPSVVAVKGRNEMPRVSLAIPVCNGERYLRSAIGSPLAQSLTDSELATWDIATSDATESICRDYVALDSLVKYPRNDFRFAAAAIPRLSEERLIGCPEEHPAARAYDFCLSTGRSPSVSAPLVRCQT